jgi:hypothetical protein
VISAVVDLGGRLNVDQIIDEVRAIADVAAQIPEPAGSAPPAASV